MSPDPNQKTILAIDDEEDVLEAVKDCLLMKALPS